MSEPVEESVFYVAAPKFYTVWGIDPSGEEFELIGVFSKKSEAETLFDQYREATGNNAGAVMPMTMVAIESQVEGAKRGELMTRLDGVSVILEKLASTLQREATPE
jgi:hypothetical protein